MPLPRASGATAASPQRAQGAGPQLPSGQSLGKIALGKITRRGALLIAAIAVCAAAVLAARHVGELNYHDLVHAMRRTPLHSILAAFAMTALSYMTLLATDWLAGRYAGANPRTGVLMLASFSGYALGNAAGFGAVSGAAVRYRIYSVAGLKPPQIGRIVAYLAVSFTFGAPLVAPATALFAPSEIARSFNVAPATLRAVTLATLAVLICAWAAARRRTTLGRFAIRLPDAPTLAAQLGLTALDIAAAGAVLWFLLPADGPAFLPFIAIYAAALVLGAASHVPGGLGVFEIAMLSALGKSVPPSELAGALLVYRA